MITLVIYSSAWQDQAAYRKWCEHRIDIEREVEVKIVAFENTYRRIVSFDDVAKAVMFKLCWADRIRIEHGDGIF